MPAAAHARPLPARAPTPVTVRPSPRPRRKPADDNVQAHERLMVETLSLVRELEAKINEVLALPAPKVVVAYPPEHRSVLFHNPWSDEEGIRMFRKDAAGLLWAVETAEGLMSSLVSQP